VTLKHSTGWTGGRRLLARAIRALAVLVVIAGSGAVGATPADDGDHHVVAVVSPAGEVTISGQVRAATAVRLRLYRFGRDGQSMLVSETEARRGESSFVFVDQERPAGDTVYHLRVVGRRGEETTLATALCVESRLTPLSSPAPSASGDQLAWTEGAAGAPELPSSDLVIVEIVTESGWIPGPEPPVPRSQQPT